MVRGRVAAPPRGAARTVGGRVAAPPRASLEGTASFVFRAGRAPATTVLAQWWSVRISSVVAAPKHAAVTTKQSAAHANRAVIPKTK